MLDEGLKEEGFFRSSFLFPMAISYIMTGAVWRWLMNPATGDRLSGFNLLFSYCSGFFDQQMAHHRKLGHCGDCPGSHLGI
ncbi:MAG: sugar ABC transporter permease [Chloroflexi bacterium]|nr:sugar ABC transporter permease [Chloroflexota bacterium]